jgi:hypothetical protein
VDLYHEKYEPANSVILLARSEICTKYKIILIYNNNYYKYLTINHLIKPANVMKITDSRLHISAI